jgi:hypothetical protein
MSIITIDSNRSTSALSISIMKGASSGSLGTVLPGPTAI